ncbi:MAG: hypothetical protein WKG07_42810 [Hymenobacter sp.]
MARYDKGGEMHYDVISAFIKSIRGSDPNAALYYLAVMLEGGEDVEVHRPPPAHSARPKTSAMLTPTPCCWPTSCFQACTVIGLPESDLVLSQTVIYLATSPKSNAAYTAIRAAQAQVRAQGVHPVPVPLRNAPTKLLEGAQATARPTSTRTTG